MTDQAPPTYEELRAERAREWAATQSAAARAQAELHASLLKMPDVAQAPSPEMPWQHDGLTCPGCRTDVFHVQRWVTVNGVRYRAELRCAACGETRTWDWTAACWVEELLARALLEQTAR